MSPDQYYGNSKYRQIVESFTAFATAYPQIAKLGQVHGTDFRGLSIWLSEGGELVTAFRSFDSDGVPVVIYSSGDDFSELLYNLNKVMVSGIWRVDAKSAKELGIDITRFEPNR